MISPMDNHDKKIPNWARRFDEAGPRRWMKEKHTNRRKGEYISAIVWNLIWLFIANKLPNWDTGFLNDHYLTVLQPLNWNICLPVSFSLFHGNCAFSRSRISSFLRRETGTEVLSVIFR